MADPSHTLTAILPCNDLDATERFYNRLGFFQHAATRDRHDSYRILSDGRGADVHLTTAVEGWVVPSRNPFGVYLYVDDVDGSAERVRSDIIGSTEGPEHKEWGMYEFAVSDPDGVLVRIGRPSRPPTSGPSDSA